MLPVERDRSVGPAPPALDERARDKLSHAAGEVGDVAQPARRPDLEVLLCADALGEVEPVYTDLAGWRTPISGAQFRRDVKLAQKRGKLVYPLFEHVVIVQPLGIAGDLSARRASRFELGLASVV